MSPDWQVYQCQQNITLAIPDIFNSVKVVDSLIPGRMKLPHFNHECYGQFKPLDLQLFVLLNWLQNILKTKLVEVKKIPPKEEISSKARFRIKNPLSNQDTKKYFKNSLNYKGLLSDWYSKFQNDVKINDFIVIMSILQSIQGHIGLFTKGEKSIGIV